MPALKLRPYQERSVSTVRSAWLRGRRKVMFQMPTGGGKTEVAAAIIQQRLQDHPEGRVVWVTHRRELNRQVQARLGAYAIPAAEGNAGYWRDGPSVGVVSVTSATTLDNNWNRDDQLFGFDDLMVVDEAHHAPAGRWEKVIADFPGNVLGLTATPWRMSPKQRFDHLFHEDLLQGPSISDLINNGYLASTTIHGPKTGDHRIIGGRVLPTGDYAPDDLDQRYWINERYSPVLLEEAINQWRDVAEGRRTVWYAMSSGHAVALFEALTTAGETAGLLLDAQRRVTGWSDTSRAPGRDEIVDRFQDGRINHIVNYEILTEGFDCPGAGCGVILRPTRSVALYRQMVGRIMRPNDGEGAIILDLAMNYAEPTEGGLGHPLANVRWSLLPRDVEPPGPGVSRRKSCPGTFAEWVDGEIRTRYCGGVYPIQQRECEIEACGHSFGRICASCSAWRSHRLYKLGNAVCDRCIIGREIEVMPQIINDPTVDRIWEHPEWESGDGFEFIALPDGSGAVMVESSGTQGFHWAIIRNGPKRNSVVPYDSASDAKQSALWTMEARATGKYTVPAEADDPDEEVPVLKADEAS